MDRARPEGDLARSDADAPPMTDMLFAAAYVSTPTAPFSDRELSELLLRARHWNARYGITGKLIAAEDDDGAGGMRVVRFVQWIEGEPERVRACLRRIHADPRHDEMEIQFFGPVASRRFAAWDMALDMVPPAGLDAAGQALVPDARVVEIDETGVLDPDVG